METQTTKQKKYRIARAINGITINGNEYLLNNSGNILMFNSIKEGKEYLKLNGLKSFKGLDFEEVKE